MNRKVAFLLGLEFPLLLWLSSSFFYSKQLNDQAKMQQTTLELQDLIMHSSAIIVELDQGFVFPLVDFTWINCM